jgi:hypothetical protein
MSLVTALNVDQFIRLARTCPVCCWERQGQNFNVYGLPLDIQLKGLTQAQFNQVLAQMPEAEEVSAVTWQ